MKKYATYLIFGLWGAASAALSASIKSWDASAPDKTLIMLSSCIIMLAISLILIQKHRPEDILNPQMAGAKTRALFAKKPMLAGLVVMLPVVGISTALMMVIS